MLNLWDIMAPAFFECLILVGIHSYLGIHVIKRKVIFVDLALAQVAALGTTVGFLFGILPGSVGAYWFSLGFAILGAGIFSILRFKHEKIPQEAVIGLVYALAAAVVILVIDKAPHGAEHIKELLTGSILWVKWGTIFKAAGVYLVVGVFHYIFRDKFLLISNNPKKAYEEGINVRFWDFLFYVSFGIVITHSVGTAGVLLVFVFLVVPAIASIMITDTLWKQLIIGWSMGLVVSVLGLYISYAADLPSGPAVVSLYGLMLLLLALILYVIKAENRVRAAVNVAAGVAAVLIITLFFSRLGTYFSEKQGHHDELSASEVIHPEAAEKEDISPAKLEKRFRNSDDYSEKLEIAGKMLTADRIKGFEMLIELAETCEYPFINGEIIAEIEKVTGNRFGYDPDKNPEENSAAIKQMKQWLKKIE